MGEDSAIERARKLLADIRKSRETPIRPPPLQQRKRKKKRRRPPKDVRRQLHAKWQKIVTAGHIAQNRTTRLLQILKEDGRVAWFKESRKNDWHDQRGIDQYGELSPSFGSLWFAVDATSNLGRKKKRPDRVSLIFSPNPQESDVREAHRLLREIVSRFG